jgi:hypothetical protein
MASKYGILSLTDLNNLVMFDLTVTDDATSARVYTDAYLTEIITQMEQLVFGQIKKTYTSATIPDDVMYVVKRMCKIAMENQLIRDEFMIGELNDEIQYYKDYLEDGLNAEEEKNAFDDITTVDDYVLTS